MPVAEVITIGTELLLGVIQDTNTSYIAKTLNTAGIDIFHASMIGDNEERIALEIRAALERADIIITTGGLGPTVDDPTRDAVALAFNRETEFKPELWDQILTRFKAYGRNPTENNKRQAFIPAGAVAIPNPVGTAPAFYIEENQKILFSLPGVPSEMKTLLNSDVLPIIKAKYPIESIIVIRTIHTAGIGESSVDELVSDLEKMSNPTVGLAAHPGQVDIRITAKANNRDLAWELIAPVETQVKQLLGDFVYGEDDITLNEVISDQIRQKDLDLVINYENQFLEIADLLSDWLEIPTVNMKSFPHEHFSPIQSSMYNHHKRKEIAVDLFQSEKGLCIMVHLLGKEFNKSIHYGGHPSNFNQWAGNHILTLLREAMINEKESSNGKS
jgi:competence/damage-inducible protein CinA-like protein